MSPRRVAFWVDRAARRKFQAGDEKFILLKPTNCADCHNPHVSYAKKYRG